MGRFTVVIAALVASSLSSGCPDDAVSTTLGDTIDASSEVLGDTSDAVTPDADIVDASVDVPDVGGVDVGADTPADQGGNDADASGVDTTNDEGESDADADATAEPTPDVAEDGDGGSVGDGAAGDGAAGDVAVDAPTDTSDATASDSSDAGSDTIDASSDADAGNSDDVGGDVTDASDIKADTGGAGSCQTADDCLLVDDCCTCEAIPTDATPPACGIQTCFVNTCQPLGVTAADVACVAGSCEIITGNCSDTFVTCKAATPICDPGFAPEVNSDGTCWTGLCLPLDLCDEVPDCDACTDDEVCVVKQTMQGAVPTCEPIPASCPAGKPTCTCMPAGTCEAPYDTCSEAGPTEEPQLTCACITC